MSWPFIGSVVAALVVGASVRIAPERGRLVVTRFGKSLGVRGPGLSFILPLIDRVDRVDLDSTIPEWRDLDESEISQRLLHMAQTGVLRPETS